MSLYNIHHKYTNKDLLGLASIYTSFHYDMVQILSEFIWHSVWDFLVIFMDCDMTVYVGEINPIYCLLDRLLTPL